MHAKQITNEHFGCNQFFFTSTIFVFLRPRYLCGKPSECFYTLNLCVFDRGSFSRIRYALLHQPAFFFFFFKFFLASLLVVFNSISLVSINAPPHSTERTHKYNETDLIFYLTFSAIVFFYKNGEHQ